VTSRRADLALVILDVPVEGDFTPMALGQEKGEVDTPIVVVGYGYDEVSGALNGTRRFSRTKIIRVQEQDDEMLLTQEEQHRNNRGDSGGPCLIETGQGPVLAGILSRSPGKDPACTRIHPYRAWLLREMERAR
jgi:hypothetical protein